MKSSVYFLAATFIFFAYSCTKKKETPYDPSGALAAVVKTITRGSTGNTDTYTYDSQGRVQLIQNSNGNKTSFEYVDSSLTQTNFDGSGAVISVTHFILDTLGLVSNAVVTDAGGTVISYHNYSFDSEKEITAENKYNANLDPNGKSEWVWINGNIYEYAIYDSAVTHKQYDSYYWYYDPAVTSIGNANTGQKFYGADPKFLVRKIVGTTWGGGNSISTFEYTFDSKQRITEARTYDYNGTLKSTDTYTYY